MYRETKLAVTVRAAFMVTVQVPLPEQPAPDQPLNRDAAKAEAVSVTTVPSAYVALHVTPQLTPPTSDVTVPVPDPVLLTARVYAGTNVAVALRAALMVTAQVVLVPEQSPDQPVKIEPVAAVAVSVTVAPSPKEALQVPPQLMPAGVDATVPLPAPVLATVRL